MPARCLSYGEAAAVGVRRSPWGIVAVCGGIANVLRCFVLALIGTNKRQENK